MKLVLLFLLSFVMMGCSSDEFVNDFPYMKGVEHRYEKVDFDEAYDILTKKTGIVVLAFDSNLYECPYCKAVLPLLNEVLYDEVDVIYYLDIYQMRRNETEEYQQLLSYLNERVELSIRNDKLTLVVPDVYFVRDGVIVGRHLATIEDEQGHFISSLNTSQKEELKTIYQGHLAKWKHE